MGKYGAGVLLGLATVVVAISFIGENAFMFWSDRQLAKESHALQVNALPSVHELSRARQHLGKLGHCVAMRSDASSVSRCTQAAGASFAEAFARYRVLPLYPGEDSLQREVDRYVTNIDDWVRGLDVGRPLTPQSVDAVLGTLESLDETLRELVVLNATQAVNHSTRIASLRRRSERFELMIGAAALLMAALATVLGIRAMRRYARSLEERARELDLFASTVAHDLVGPLTSVGMAMPVIQERHPDDETTQLLAGRALKGVRRARILVDGLLEFARASAATPAGSTQLAEVVETVVADVDDYARSERVEIVSERVDRVDVACAPAVLASILSNLLRNAIKHMGDADPRAVRIRATATADHVRVEIEDTGPGVPAHEREAIFEPHVRLAPGQTPGLGLGLATVKRLVSAHRGVVGVSDGPRQGAIFWFDLPLHRAV